MANHLWTADEDTALTAYVRAKVLSYRLIAEAINSTFATCFTRNATIGRAMRLGLRDPQDKRIPCESLNGHGTNRPKKVVIRVRRLREAPPMFQDDPGPVDAPTSLCLTLDQLEPRSCRWPGESAPFTYCGCQSAAKGMPYCFFHTLMAQRRPNE